MPTTTEGHYANEVLLNENDTEISVTDSWTFSGYYGFAFLTADNVLIYAEPTRTNTGITIDATQYIALGAKKFRVSVKSTSIITINSVIKGLNQKISDLQSETEGAKSDILTLNNKFASIFREKMQGVKFSIENGFINENGIVILSGTTLYTDYINVGTAKRIEVSVIMMPTSAL